MFPNNREKQMACFVIWLNVDLDVQVCDATNDEQNVYSWEHKKRASFSETLNSEFLLPF